MATGFGFCASCGTAATGLGEKFCGSCGAALPAGTAAAAAVPPPYAPPPPAYAPPPPPYGQPPYGQPPYGQPYGPGGPARSAVNPLLLVVGALIILAIVGVGALALTSKNSPSSSGGSSPSAVGSGGGTGVHYPGSLVFSPASVGCDEALTITTKLPSSVTDTDPITLQVDGVVIGTHTVIDAGMTMQADGSWSGSATGTSDCSMGPGLHTEQLVDASGQVLAEGSFTIVESSSAKPTTKTSAKPTTKTTAKPTQGTGGSVTIEPSSFSCSAASVDVRLTGRLPASVPGSTRIATEIDGSVGATTTVASGFEQQADGSWLSSSTNPSTTLCGHYTTGNHTIRILDSAGNVLAEGTFTVNP